MERQVYSRLLLLLVLGLVGAVSNPQSGAAVSRPSSTLDRLFEPVILNTNALPAFVGTPVDDIFVYALRGGAWSQIPFQVDEISQADRYSPLDDGIFNSRATANGVRFDELVFMAKDAGDQAPGAPVIDGQPFNGAWYKVEVTNPVNPSAKGWVYVVRSDALNPTLEDYVNFSPATRQLTGQTYEFGFATSSGDRKQWIDVLKVGAAGSRGPDILDRTPNVDGCAKICLNEEELDRLARFEDDQFIKDGRVRVILRDGRMKAYGSTLEWSVYIPPFPTTPTYVQFSTDFNRDATGAKFFNAATPSSGVIVDGVPDAVPTTPFSRWWQLATSSGSVIQVGNYASAGGTLTNYYQDNATASDPTGEPGYYADTGARINNPNNGFTYSVRFYFLPGAQGKVGDKYQEYFDNELKPLSEFHEGRDGRVTVFLPLVMK